MEPYECDLCGKTTHTKLCLHCGYPDNKISEMKDMEPVVAFRKLVMPKDLNPANRLFGGTMMAWIDEAAALYASCQAKTHNLVTASISQITFSKPVMQGDFLVFKASLEKVGTSSMIVTMNVLKKDVNTGIETLVTDCEMVFVTIDPDTGKPVPHGMEQFDNRPDWKKVKKGAF